MATYNIQGMRPGTDPETRIQHIINKFIALDPDIIGLQEINATSTVDNQAKVISDSLTNHFGVQYHYYYEKTHDAWDNQFKEYVGIISKYEFKEQGYLNLTPGMFPRKVVWGLFDTSIGKINFFSTHLDYWSAWVNEKEIDEVLNFAGVKMAMQSNNNTIIVGDFNATPNTPSYLKMTNANYTDSYKFIHPNSDGFTASFPGQTIRIDYIFVPSYSDLVINNSYLFGDQPISQDFYCSDHLGILTTFSNPSYVDVEDDEYITAEFTLSQNYPNPFNPSTTIKYNIPLNPPSKGDSEATGCVTLKVYDIQGNEITELVNAKQQPGDYQIVFDGKNQSNGIYFYKLSHGNKSEIKKMLLVK
ncbi:endonuclease/exonuclease/phosphatase family protein [bacterium]|nr:endonuclease/exonuclease/phosphatase family protein [bacterium]